MALVDNVVGGDDPYKLPEQANLANVPYKYGEAEILAELKAYVDGTYKGHYVGKDNVQSFDLILASGHAEGFCIGSILKYASRYGKKGGFNRQDLLKIVHYGLLALHDHTKNKKV